MMQSKGYSVLELLIVLVVLLIITGAVFQVIKLTTERSSTEQVKLDMFQEAREFMDQMARDLRQAGYPNIHNMDYTVLSSVQSPLINDYRFAAGLIEVSKTDLWFEGDVDNSGTVSVGRYYLETSTTNGCPCLRRSQVAKANGDPLSNTS